jgi:hypothetical protein
MACPTCSHTMHRIGAPDQMSGPVWWCPRCGTIKSTDPGGFDSVEAPKLVKRCRQLLDGVLPGETVEIDAGTLHRLGIAECIDRPDSPPDS